MCVWVGVCVGGVWGGVGVCTLITNITERQTSKFS